jgi:hypothetical protein
MQYGIMQYGIRKSPFFRSFEVFRVQSPNPIIFPIILLFEISIDLLRYCCAHSKLRCRDAIIVINKIPQVYKRKSG